MINAITVAVDAMGGDNAPAAIVKGVVDAVNNNECVTVKLVGIKEAVEAELSKYTYDHNRIEVIGATEVIETAEHPVNAIRRKKDSSMVVAMNLVKAGEADAFVSAGSTGAILVGAQAIIGRIPGVKRPPLAPVLPTAKGPPQNTSSDVETKPQRRWILLSDLQDLRSSTPAYGPEYPAYGTDLPYSATTYQTKPDFLPAYKLRSFPVSRTDGFDTRHAPRCREHPFPYGSMGNNWSMSLADPFHR